MKTAKRNQRGSCILGVVIVAIGIGVIAYMLTKDTMLQRGDTRHLTFTVEASGVSANITLSDSVGAQSFSGVTSTPWNRTATYQAGTQVYLTAGNPSGYGTIKCAITIDGRQWKNNEATSPSDKVGCAGIIP
jgi:hypothetical protein